MKFRRRGYAEAEAEALRIATAFLAAKVRSPDDWSRECATPSPDESIEGFDRRKPIVRWTVWVRPKPPDGCSIDGGGGFLVVDIETKEARWSDEM
jgi:hypothetical protein